MTERLVYAWFGLGPIAIALLALDWRLVILLSPILAFFLSTSWPFGNNPGPPTQAPDMLNPESPNYMPRTAGWLRDSRKPLSRTVSTKRMEPDCSELST